MKTTTFIFTLFLTSFQLFSQQLECACDSMEIAVENRYKCEIQNFQNGSRLYWQWNCDSSWLTFENREKVILKSCENETVYGCQRAGLEFLKEYNNYLLFQYKWNTGCCASPEMVFISKETGREIERISQEQFVWGDIDKDYLLYFSDSTYTSLILLDHLIDRKNKLEFPSKQIDNSIRENQVLRLTDLFQNIEKNDNLLTFDFRSADGDLTSKRIEIK